MNDKPCATFKIWMLLHYTHNELADLCNHGAVNGFSGLTYYTETAALYDQYHEDVWGALYEESESLGKSCLALLASFHGANDVGSDVQLKNLLIWYLAEKIAFEVTQGEYLPDVDE